jgi:dethiobiotin synthetase
VHAPITEKVWISDLAQKWKYPVLVVARAGLGTLNHTLLTLEALRHRKIQILGVLVNGAKGKDGSEKTNILALRRLAGVSVFGPVRWNPCYRQDLDDLARVLDALGILPNRRKKT